MDSKPIRFKLSNDDKSRASLTAFRSINQCAAVEVTLKAGVCLIALCYVAEDDLEQSTLEALANQHLARYKHPRILPPLRYTAEQRQWQAVAPRVARSD